MLFSVVDLSPYQTWVGAHVQMLKLWAHFAVFVTLLSLTVGLGKDFRCPGCYLISEAKEIEDCISVCKLRNACSDCFENYKNETVVEKCWEILNCASLLKDDENQDLEE